MKNFGFHQISVNAALSKELSGLRVITPQIVHRLILKYVQQIENSFHEPNAISFNETTRLFITPKDAGFVEISVRECYVPFMSRISDYVDGKKGFAFVAYNLYSDGTIDGNPEHNLVVFYHPFCNEIFYLPLMCVNLSSCKMPWYRKKQRVIYSVEYKKGEDDACSRCIQRQFIVEGDCLKAEQDILLFYYRYEAPPSLRALYPAMTFLKESQIPSIAFLEAWESKRRGKCLPGIIPKCASSIDEE